MLIQEHVALGKIRFCQCGHPGLHCKTSGKSGPSFLTEHAAFHECSVIYSWTIAMFFWPSNLYELYRTYQHNWSIMSRRQPTLHLSSLATGCSSHQVQNVDAYRTATGPLTSTNSTSRSLRSVSEQHLMVPLQKDKSLFQTFTFTVPRWWNDLLNPT